MSDILIGNSFPLSLIRRKVEMELFPLSVLKKELEDACVFSYWGHSNTLASASRLLGRDLSPQEERPVLTLSAIGLPVLDGREFTVCWILSPDYAGNFRPKTGEEVDSSMIVNWQCLKITWSGK